MYSIHIHTKIINLGFQESHLIFWAFFTKSSSILEWGEIDMWTSKSLQSFLPSSPSSSTPSLIIVFLAVLAMLIYLKSEGPPSELLDLHHLQNLCLVLPSLLPHFQFLFHKTSIYLKNLNNFKSGVVKQRQCWQDVLELLLLASMPYNQQLRTLWQNNWSSMSLPSSTTRGIVCEDWSMAKTRRTFCEDNQSMAATCFD